MIMIKKTPASQMGSPAAAEKGGEGRNGGRGREKVSASTRSAVHVDPRTEGRACPSID